MVAVRSLPKYRMGLKTKQTAVEVKNTVQRTSHPNLAFNKTEQQFIVLGLRFLFLCIKMWICRRLASLLAVVEYCACAAEYCDCAAEDFMYQGRTFCIAGKTFGTLWKTFCSTKKTFCTSAVNPSSYSI